MPRTITLRRVVVTGLGAVTDVGIDVPSFWKSLLEGRSGIGPITNFPTTPDWPTRFGGEVTCTALVTEFAHDVCGRADERDASGGDGIGEVGILRKKPATGVEQHRSGTLCAVDDVDDVEIRRGGGRVADEYGVVGESGGR